MAEKSLTDDAKVMLGDYRKALVAMTVPLFISLIIAQANTFIDTFWCSMLGSTALAAVGVVSSYYMVIVGLGSGIGIGVSAVIAAHIACGDKRSADRTASQALVFMTVIGLICTPILLLIGDPILKLVADDAFSEAADYALPYYLGAVVLVVQGIMVGILRGEGAAKRSMVITVVTALLNIVLDPLFAFVLDLGIVGLSLATVVATTVSMVPFVYWYFIKTQTSYVDIRLKGFRFDSGALREFLSVGAPKALEIDIMWGLNFILCYFVMVCGGSSSVAVYTTGWKYVDVIQVPSTALGGALVPICSAAFATGDRVKLRFAYLYTMVRAVAITAVLAVVLYVFSDYAVMVFSNSESSRSLEGPMAEAIRIYVLVAVMFSAITVSSSFLQAIRRSGCSMWSTLLRNLVLIAVFAALCHTTPVAMWWGFVGAEVFGLVLMCGWAEYEYRKIRGTCSACA